MRGSILAAVMAIIVTDAAAQTAEYEGPCSQQNADQQVRSPDPAENPDGFGQLVGERGETNSHTKSDDHSGDAYTGDPAYGNCDGRWVICSS